MSMLDQINAVVQHVLPQHLLSRCMYRATRWRWTPWKKLIIQMIINRYKVDMTIAEQADANAYGNFNE